MLLLYSNTLNTKVQKTTRIIKYNTIKEYHSNHKFMEHNMSCNGKNHLFLMLIGAVAFAGVVTAGVTTAADIFYGKHEEGKRGYTIEIAANEPAPASPASAPVTASAPATPVADAKVEIAPYIAKADLELGGKLIKHCHSFEKGKPNGVGPNQYGLVGRKIASAAGYTYSNALKAKSGVWDEQSLSDFIAAPMKAVSGTKMTFAGLKKPEERAAVIAYIKKNFSDK